MSVNKKRFFNNKAIPTKFSISYILIGVLGILSIDKLVTIFFTHNSIAEQGPLTFGILFLLSTGIILFIMLNHMQKVIKKIEISYKELKDKDKERLIPYEFALNNSIDAIYWFTLEGKFVYVNEAACKMVGYSKDEFLSMHLEDMDPNFNRQTAVDCMHEIYNDKNWRLETTQVTKEGETFPVEVSGHGFNYGGKDYICAFARDMTQRLKYRTKITNMNQELQKSVDEKEILLKEIHHRVKNNMEIISSLLSMQYRRSDDEELKYILQQSRGRINTMALVHEFLYLGKNLAYINLHDYILRLVDDIQELYITKNTKLEIDLHIDELIFSTNRCIQIGMVLHELCVNSLKYAFSEDKDNILCIHIKQNNDKIDVKIRDNGLGHENIDSLYKTDSIGMQLIHSIVEDQLDGIINFKNNNGLECNISFNKEEE
jgi:two-component system, sensor histidine kinase PdtaS